MFIPIAEFIDRYATLASAAIALGIHQTQLKRWIKYGAVIAPTGVVYIPTTKHIIVDIAPAIYSEH